MKNEVHDKSIITSERKVETYDSIRQCLKIVYYTILLGISKFLWKCPVRVEKKCYEGIVTAPCRGILYHDSQQITGCPPNWADNSKK